MRSTELDSPSCRKGGELRGEEISLDVKAIPPIFFSSPEESLDKVVTRPSSLIVLSLAAIKPL